MKSFAFSTNNSLELFHKQMNYIHKPAKDLNKRLKCLQGLYKQEQNELKNFFNNYWSPIFDILYQSIIK